MQYRAAAALRHADLDRARVGLWEQLQLMAVATGATASWATMTVDGPTPVLGRDGSTWFEWTATVTVSAGRGEIDDNALDRLVRQGTDAVSEHVDTARHDRVLTD